MKHLNLLPPNPQGRDFFTGDLHGMYDALCAEMTAQGFNTDTDRLICTGDLIDRGTDSERCLQLLAQPWFFAVCGNHETMMLDALLRGHAKTAKLWKQNGGDWAKRIDKARLQHYCLLIDRTMSRLLQVTVAGQVIGVTHAEYPLPSWQRQDEINGDPLLEQTLMWSRNQFRSSSPHQIDGVDRMVHGHSVVDQPTRLGNRLYIDTGAYLSGRVELFTAQQLINIR